MNGSDSYDLDFAMKSISQRIRMVGLAIAFAIVAMLALLPLNYTGFCFGKMGYLTDDEFFDIAIKGVLRDDAARRVSTGVGDPTFTKIKILSYGSVADFKSRNPNCCEYVSHAEPSEDPPISFMSRLFGLAAKQVSVTYVQNYLDENGETKSRMRRVIAVIDNCGTIRH